MAWVYILECKDGSYYTGSTPDLGRRVAEHQAGEGGRYTALRLPVRLVFSYAVPRIEDAFYLERQLKGWRRQKKEALMRGDYTALVELSKPTRDKERAIGAHPSTGSGWRSGVNRPRVATLRLSKGQRPLNTVLLPGDYQYRNAR
ncbi:MAG: GIY-YIG nuclease family protein [Dehalococcoidia bacterium]